MKIIDEFTDLPVSRQRKKQLRYQRDNRCMICGQPREAEATNKVLCVRHTTAFNQQQRARAGFQPWQPGKAGRPRHDQQKAVA